MAPPGPDGAIARVAHAQHGVISRGQLREAGLGGGAISKRAAAGRLHRVALGVYAVGHARLTHEGRCVAAVLTCGEGAKVARRTSAALLGLRPSSAATIDVVTPGAHVASRAGVAVQCTRDLPECDVTEVDGIPCTSWARTIVDLAAVLPRRDVERALHQAERLRLFDLRTLEDVLDRGRGRRGVAAVRAVLAEHAFSASLADGDLVQAFLALVHGARLSPPELEVDMVLPDGTPIRIDALWRAQRLAVELDGRASHSTRASFESDRHRDVQLTVAGLRPVRFTGLQIARRPGEVQRSLAALLGSAV